MSQGSLQEALQLQLDALREEADRHCRKCRAEVKLFEEAVAKVSGLLLALDEGAREGSAATTPEAEAKLQKRVYFQIAQCASLGPESPVAVVSKALRWYEVEEPDALFQRCAQELARLPLRDGRTSEYVALARGCLELMQKFAERDRKRVQPKGEPDEGVQVNKGPEAPKPASPGASGVAPPPPPAMPPAAEETQTDEKLDSVPPGEEKKAFLAEIQQAGESITNMLRRSRPDRSKNAAEEEKAAEKHSEVETSSAVAGGAPLLQFERSTNRWRVERYRAFSDEPLQVSICHPREAVYIFRCETQSIRIRNKCNTIMLDACKNVGVLLDSVVSAIEIVRCSRCKLQFTGDVPSVSIDNSDSITLYGTPGQVITCCATEVAIVEAIGETDRETAVPQQFITRRQAIDPQATSDVEASKTRWVTEPLTHLGAE
jgi:hypothetical protein